VGLYMKIYKLLIVFLFLIFTSWSSFSQNYPNKPIRLIVPFPPGGVADIIARPLAENLSSLLGQSVIIENKAGATGTIGASFVANSAPDGYTLLLGTSNEIAMSPSLFKTLPYDPNKAFTPISPVGEFPNVLVVGPHLPVKSFNDFLSLIRKDPGKISFASSGTGSTNHLTAVLFANQAKLSIQHVPYKGGGPAVADLLGGHVDALFATLPSAIAQIKAGKLQALAVTGEYRSSLLPDVPTIRELGIIGVSVTTWNGVLGPANISPVIVQQINKAIATIVSQQNFKDKMQSVGVEAISSQPQEFLIRIRGEYEKWSNLVRGSNLILD